MSKIAACMKVVISVLINSFISCGTIIIIERFPS